MNNRKLIHKIIDNVLDLCDLINQEEIIFQLSGYDTDSDLASKMTDYDEFKQELVEAEIGSYTADI